MQETDTPIEGETVTSEAQGITENTATDSQVTESESVVDATSSEVEKLRKELQKLEMERNMLRNKQDDERRKKLEEDNEFKALYEETQAKLAQREADDQARADLEAARKLRQQFIDDYPDPTVRKVAEKLIEKNESNLTWGDVETEEEARSAIHSQLDALRETLGISQSDDEDTDIVVPANNPSVKNTNPAELSWEQMRDVLPKADPR